MSWWKPSSWVLLVGACGCHGNGAVDPPDAQTDSVPADVADGAADTAEASTPADFSSLGATIEAERKTTSAVGCTVSIRHRGRVAFTGAFGARVDSTKPLQTSTTMRIASVSKLLTAVTLLRLIEAGKLSLATKVVDVLPGFALAGAPGEAGLITVRHLLTHTSGIGDGTADEWKAEPKDDGMLARYVTAVVPSYLLQFRPGRTYDYTNVGYDVAGAVAEKVGGKPFAQLVQAEVLGRLGMKRTFADAAAVLADGDFSSGRGSAGLTIDPTIDWSPAGAPSGRGSAYHASVDDLAELARFVLSGDATVLTPATWSSMTVDPVDTEAPWSVGLYHGERSGLGLQIHDGVLIGETYHPVRLHGHWGSGRGYASMLWAAPELDFAFVSLCNGHDGFLDQSFLRALEIAGLTATAPRPAVGVDPALFPKLVGTYHEPRALGDVVVKLVDGKLVAAVPTYPDQLLAPEHGLGFQLDVRADPFNQDGVVRFVLDATGKPELLRNRYWVAKRVE